MRRQRSISLFSNPSNLLAVTFLVLKAITLTNGLGVTKVTSPEVQPVYVAKGGALRLTCTQTEGRDISWSFKPDRGSSYAATDGGVNGFYSTSHHVQPTGYLERTLYKDQANVSDSGSYRCSLTHLLLEHPNNLNTVVDDTSSYYVVDVIVLAFEETPGLLTKQNEPVTLGCSLAATIRPAAMRWVRNGRVITEEVPEGSVLITMTTGDGKTVVMETRRDRPMITGRRYTANYSETETATTLTLSIRDLFEEDVGEYGCNFDLQNGNNYTFYVNLYATPRMRVIGRSVNAAEGDTVDLTCRGFGWPSPRVEWKREDGQSLFPSNPSSAHRIRILPDNTTLRIENATATDRAYYVCGGCYNFSEATIAGTIGNITLQTLGNECDYSRVLLRVKGRYAAMWPLCGILIELIVLCIIIYFYEKRKAKEKREEEIREATDSRGNRPSSSNAQHSPRYSGGGPSPGGRPGSAGGGDRPRHRK